MPEELLRAAIGIRLSGERIGLTIRSLDRLAAELVDILGVGVRIEEMSASIADYGTVRMRIEADHHVARVLEGVFREMMPVGIRFEVEGMEAERDDLVFGMGRSPIGRVGRHVPGLHEIASRLRVRLEAAPELPRLSGHSVVAAEQIREMVHRDRADRIDAAAANQTQEVTKKTAKLKLVVRTTRLETIAERCDD